MIFIIAALHTEILSCHGRIVLTGTQNIKTPNCYEVSLCLFFNKIIVLESTKTHSTWAVFLFCISFYLSFIQSFTLKPKISSNNPVLSERITRYQILDPYFTICIILDPDFFPYKAFIPCMTCFDFWTVLWLPCRSEFARSSLIHADIPSPGIFQEVTTYIDVCERSDSLVGISYIVNAWLAHSWIIHD